MYVVLENGIFILEIRLSDLVQSFPNQLMFYI